MRRGGDFMAQEQGIVSSISDDGWAQVLTERHEAHAKGTVSHCCTPTGPGSRMVIRAMNRAGAKAGDLVSLDIGSGALIKSALLMYLTPMIGLVCGAVLGSALHQNLGLDETLAGILFGVAGFSLAFLIARAASGRMGKGGSLTPVITTVLKHSLKGYPAVGAVDPVCDMAVDTVQAPARYEYRGKMYYFCHPGCKETFQKDPEKYV